MGKLRKWVVSALLLSLTVSSLQGQDYDSPELGWYCEEDPCCPAYEQGTQTAHWSVYIPISVLAVAAILFGLSDRNHKDKFCDSPDALRSIDQSRCPSRCLSGSYHSRSCGCSCGVHCH